jgi:hypothetical protein
MHCSRSNGSTQKRGLTLPQAVLLLQPVLRCRAGRCRTCLLLDDFDQLTLFRRRE